MALLPIHKYFIFNDKLKPISEFIPTENNGGIYEVLRVVKGVPLFFEEHLTRLYKSAKMGGRVILYSKLEIQNLLKLLIEKNGVDEGNLLISCKTNLKIFFISHNYPSMRMYEEGVNCGILNAERENPNAKIFQTTVREKANEIISKQSCYEVILVDKNGRVTEGSRSNLFFVKGNKIFSSLGKDVLLGVTRGKTIELVKKLNINFEEKNIELKDLHLFDAIFITGTSAKILPVKQIGETSFDSQNEILIKLLGEYEALLKEYVKKRLINLQ